MVVKGFQFTTQSLMLPEAKLIEIRKIVKKLLFTIIFWSVICFMSLSISKVAGMR
jgi:hypothetical protein